MQIYSETDSYRQQSMGRKQHFSRRNQKACIVAIAGLAAIGSIAMGAIATHPEHPATQLLVTAIQNPTQLKQIWTHRNARRKLIAELPALSVDLKYKHSYLIQQQRQQAIAAGIVTGSKKDFVPATLTYQSEDMPIKLRLKPGPPAALATDQWPYQIEIENDDRPLGMKRFSLYPPQAAFFLSEQLWLSHLQKENLIARRTQLVQLIVNGSSQGVFALEDEFSKELIKDSDRPEGLFLEYGESALGEDALEIDVTVTRPGHIKKYFGLQRQEESAIAQLTDFSLGNRSASAVFDLETTAKFLAIASLWPEEAALNSTRTYFYYNPTTARLEPAGFHYLPNAAPTDTAAPKLSSWVVKLLQDPEFVAVYNRERQRLTDSAYLDSLKESLNKDIQDQNTLLQPIAADDLIDPVWEKLYDRATQSDTLVAIANTLPKRVASVQQSEEAVSGETISKEADSRETISEKAARSLSNPTIPQLLAQHSFLTWSDATQQLSIKPGTWQVTGDLIIPPNVSLQATANTTLQFEPKAMLISRGPLSLSGTAKAPITLAPQATSWGGLEIWDVKDTSQLQHVNIKQTTGGTLIHNSPISMANTHFTGSQARDALKLSHSSFTISDSTFKDFKDDAIDTDKAEGTIQNTQFNNMGGDGIDVSDSKVTLSNVTVSNVEDKAISVGQNSTLTATDISVSSVAIALAALDSSTATITRLQATDIGKTALAAYQDRLGFGPSFIKAKNSQFQSLPYDVIAQTNSRITLDGDTLTGTPQSSHLLHELSILTNEAN